MSESPAKKFRDEDSLEGLGELQREVVPLVGMLGGRLPGGS